jgi:hypothetical protein
MSDNQFRMIETRPPAVDDGKVHIASITVEWMDDPDGNNDYRAPESHHDGEWYGVQASAEVRYHIGGGNWRCETLTSAGLWGIDEPYADAEADELVDLEDHLKRFNVDVSNFTALAKTAAGRRF